MSWQERNSQNPLLAFLPNSFERLVISFLVDETSVVGIALHPTVILGIVSLGAVANLTIAMAVAFWGIGSHIISIGLNEKRIEL